MSSDVGVLEGSQAREITYAAESVPLPVEVPHGHQANVPANSFDPVEVALAKTLDVVTAAGDLEGIARVLGELKARRIALEKERKARERAAERAARAEREAAAGNVVTLTPKGERGGQR